MIKSSVIVNLGKTSGRCFRLGPNSDPKPGEKVFAMLEGQRHDRACPFVQSIVGLGDISFWSTSLIYTYWTSLNDPIA